MISFLVHAMDDHHDRVKNTRIVLKWIRRNFPACELIASLNVDRAESIGLDYSFLGAQCDRVIIERGASSHSTRYMNRAARLASCDVVAYWMHDVVLEDPRAVRIGEGMLIDHVCDFLYPYQNGYSIEKRDHEDFEKDFNFSRIRCVKRPSPRAGDKLNWGYAVMARKATWIESGGLNEDIVEYGPIDKEARDRWLAMGYVLARIESDIFHLRHWRPRDDGKQNPLERKNDEIYRKVLSMSKAQLFDYVTRWRE